MDEYKITDEDRISIRKLVDKTCLSPLECRNALIESKGDFGKAFLKLYVKHKPKCMDEDRYG